ncbi:N-acetylmuramoyl-L-alanine amidase [Solicola sp. PLA-1-18]|uniref:N-acetylmuramoyl-L-alanine amidase n=1 Tax=Solicola sp. PLA-1-18 TaxID=3380532 RepID=UPI003B815DAD
MSSTRLRVAALTVVGGLAAALVPTVVPASAAPASPAVDCSWARPGTSVDQALARASASAGVPERLLTAVSYLQSRWQDHDGAASRTGGYGVMNLSPTAPEDARGDDSRASEASPLDQAAALTGLSRRALVDDPASNVCGGAAVLASWHAGEASSLASWRGAVARWAGEGDGQDLVDLTWELMREGQSGTTATGEQVALAADPDLAAPTAPRGRRGPVDCPRTLDCEWLPSPYTQDPATGGYGNYDQADRPRDLDIDFIVVHDTESDYDGTIATISDPRSNVSWNYTVRSSDGHVVQHLDPKDVGYQAGNWWINTHSIGIEHEGKAGTSGWFTEAQYRASARLVRYLTAKYDVPRDRAHVIGHDQVPGTVPGATRNVHWDPGPYWDWEHYMDLVRAPIGGARRATTRVVAGDVVTVRPGYDGNRHVVTGCEEASPGSGACDPTSGTNYVELRQAPDASAPLARDAGWRPDGSASTTGASEIGGRAAAGTQLVVHAVQGEWVQVAWAGELVWLRNPASRPVLVRGHGTVVTVRPGSTSAPTYGRAYPEQAAYRDPVPYQAVLPIEYTLKPGQQYVVGDADVRSDYYYAKSFDGSVPGDRTVVRGSDRYLWVWTGHRMTFVKRGDVVQRRR